MSPSLWWDHRSILEFFHSQTFRPALKIWLDMGTAEGERHLRDADLLYKRLVKSGWNPGLDLQYMKAEGAMHNEDAWSERFGAVLEFLFPAKDRHKS
jgi:predicted alpha/beta superfamily hydrolase